MRTTQKISASLIAMAIVITIFDMWPAVNKAISYWPGTNIKTDSHDQKILRLIVTRSHGGRKSQTDINYRTASGELDASDTLVGPGRWVQVVRVARKDMLSLRAYQPSSGDLTCRIEGLGGDEVDSTMRIDIGSVRCYYNRK